MDPNTNAKPNTQERQGLSKAEAQAKLNAGLGNKPLDHRSRSVGQIVRDNVFTYFNLVNLILAVLVLIAALRDPAHLKNLLFMGVVVLNTGIGILQEVRAKQTIDRLSILTESHATVIRDGEALDIPAHEIVPGDLLRLESGRQISIDGKVLHSESLEIDESLLTGESDAILKKSGDPLYAGTYVIAGNGLAHVEKVSADTTAARITGEARQEKRRSSSMTRSLDKLIKYVSLVIFPLGLLLFGKQFLLLRGGDFANKLVGTVGVLLSMLPEGLILLTSIAFAVSIVQLGRRRCLVQNMTAIETLARVDTLCLDKTGTITTGKMNLVGLLIPASDAQSSDIFYPSPNNAELQNLKHELPRHMPDLHFTSDSGEAIHPIESALRALSAVFPEGNATQSAINRVYASEHSGSRHVAEAVPVNASSPTGLTWKAREVYPFSSERKWSGADFGEHGVWISGAAEKLIAESDFSHLFEQIHILSGLGYRVLCLLRAEEPAQLDGQKWRLPAGLKPVALLVISDELRPDARETFAHFRRQNVDLKLISGDNPRTVRAIAQRAGIADMDRWIDMSTLDEDADLSQVAQDYQLFGRVSPFQKRSLLKALREAGHIVAMTGDGVNDVLALKDADCGVAMASGSDAARSAADIVLVDNRMSGMVEAFYEGRRVVNNIQRVAPLFLVKTTYAALFALLMLLLPISYPIYPIQATLVASATIGIPSFFLALKPNRERIEGTFPANVLPGALPAGLAAVLMLLILQVVQASGALTSHEARFCALIVLLAVSLRALFTAAQPLTLLRSLLLLFCVLAPTIALIFFNNIFMVPQLTAGSLLHFVLPYGAASLLLCELFYFLLRTPFVRAFMRRKLGPSKADLKRERGKKE